MLIGKYYSHTISMGLTVPQLLHNLKHEKGKGVGNWLLDQPWSQPPDPPSLFYHLFQLPKDHVLRVAVLLIESDGLQFGPDDLERVRDGGGKHP